MAKSKKPERKSDPHHHLLSLRKLSSRCTKVCGDAHNEKKASEKKEWEDAECSVCLEFPHNAVLLLCSSYDKGCRPYMCATSHRFSNCLEQYTKITTDKSSKTWKLSPESDSSGILCPLCRGQVKGWTVVEPARRFLNAKKRACLHEGCSFRGRYKELRKHVRLQHPMARPRDVDPSHAEKWKKLENERERDDVLSTIMSAMPGAVVVGDFVIERDHHYDSDYGDEYDDDDIDSDNDMDGYMFQGGGYGGRGSVSERHNPPTRNVRLLAARMTGRLRGQGR